MRKLLLSSIVLSIFAIALTVFQISCKKEATAQQSGSNYTLPTATTSTLGGVIVGSGLTITSNGTLSANSSNTSGGLTQLNLFLYTKGIDSAGINVQNTYWISNIDGTNQKQVPIILPSGLFLDDNAKLTPDGKTIIFSVYDKPWPKTNWIYSCSIDGSNLKKLTSGTTNGILKINGVY